MSTLSLSPASARPERLRTNLITLASVEAGYTLLHALSLFAPDMERASLIAKADLIVAPILAVAAVLFAMRDRLPLAIIALAAIVLTTWASELTSAHLDGFALVLAHVVRPVVAIAAIVLALGGTRLVLAATLVAGAWLIWFWVTFLGEVLIFIAAVMIYGV